MRAPASSTREGLGFDSGWFGITHWSSIFVANSFPVLLFEPRDFNTNASRTIALPLTHPAC